MGRVGRPNKGLTLRKGAYGSTNVEFAADFGTRTSNHSDGMCWPPITMHGIPLASSNDWIEIDSISADVPWPE